MRVRVLEKKRRRAAAVQNLADTWIGQNTRSVLDCGGPPPLFLSYFASTFGAPNLNIIIRSSQRAGRRRRKRSIQKSPR